MNGDVPKHVQLRERLAERARTMRPGDPFPSERTLMESYGVSRATVRKSLDTLELDGLLTRTAGKGTFVSTSRVLSTLHLASFTEDMRRRGRTPSTRVLSVEHATAQGAARSHLGDGPAWRVRRVHSVDSTVMALEDSWWSCDIAPGLGQQDLTGSLYDLVGRLYLPVDQAEQTVWAESADPGMGRALQVAPGTALLAFERRSWAGARPAEFTTSWYRGDRYAVNMHLDLGMSR